LDRYEGIGPEFRMPHEYQRQQQPVRLDNGRSVMAWLYLYNRPTAGLEIIEAGDSDETDSDK
ncbi:MAG: gamma-glutamylcyclotransferase, partial [Gammaproteobacteria bacterium]